MDWPAGIVFPKLADDHVGRLTERGRCYESDLLTDMKERVRPGSLVVDVGAHMGVHTVWLGAICGCQVVALEPRPQMFEKLRANVRANRLDVRLIQAAAGSAPGWGSMEDMTLHPGEGRVRIITLDSLRLEDVALVKIDVEGFEMQVLAGAEETISRSKPLLYVESRDLHTLTAWMTERGYVRFGRFASTPVYGFAA